MSHETIVIVDDEVELTKLLQIELESEGFKVLSAQDGKAGLQLIQNSHPDLAILDIMMPEMDGYEVLKNLKGDKATKDIPVVLLTAKTFDADIQKGLQLGADDYIPKPFHAGLLIKRIHTLLGQPAAATTKKKILIVEDDPEMRKVLTLELESAGYEVFLAEDGEMGFNLARDVKPDLIISDILMPKFDGNQLMKKMRETKFGRNIPFFILTGRANMKDYFEVMDVDDFLAKPFDPHVFLKKVNELLYRQEVKTALENKAVHGDGFTKKRAILLEEDLAVSQKLGDVFEEYGYFLKIVKTVAECLEQAAVLKPDIIITKFALDGMPVDQLIPILKAMPSLKDVSVMVYTNKIQAGEKEKIISAGGSDLVEYVDSLKLFDKVNEVFRKKDKE